MDEKTFPQDWSLEEKSGWNIRSGEFNMPNKIASGKPYYQIWWARRQGWVPWHT